MATWTVGIRRLLVGLVTAGLALTAAPALAAGNPSGAGDSTPSPDPTAIVLTGQAKIDGTARVGNRLTAVPGVWDPTPEGITYQWTRNGASIKGAVSPTLQLTAADYGTTIGVKVGVKSGTLVGATTAQAPARIAAGILVTGTRPAVTGTAKVGSVLKVSRGTWIPTPDKVTYQWLRNGVPISRATRTSYTLTSADHAKTISVRATVAKAAYAATTSTSAATSRVAAGNFKVSKVAVSGTAKVGRTLTVTAGTWAPERVSFRYQWYVDGRKVAGATRYRYSPAASAAGGRVSVRVTGARTGYATTTVSRTVSTRVAKGSLTRGTVKIVGVAGAEQTLTAVTGGWGPGAVKITYQWYVGGKAVRGATTPFLTPTWSMVGKRVQVKVKATKNGYNTVTLLSRRTATIKGYKIDPRCKTDGMVVCVDKNSRKVRLVVKGEVTMSMDARFGRPGLRTANGVFTVWFKSRDHHSSLYNNAWMPFALFFHGGQAVHYSPEFASIGYTGVGSHGCVNLRDFDGARRLFDRVPVGTKVVVYGQD